MNHRTQTLGIGSLALACLLAAAGCEDIEDVQTASKISSDQRSQSSGQASDVMAAEVIFEPNMGTMSLRPEANPERNV